MNEIKVTILRFGLEVLVSRLLSNRWGNCDPNNKKNIRMININHTEAKGPTYARYLCSTLYKDEVIFFTN